MLRPGLRKEDPLATELREAAAGRGMVATPGANVRLLVEGLLTDGASAVFALERDRLTLRRRQRDALLTRASDPASAPDLDELDAACREIEDQIAELRELLDAIRRRNSVRAPS